jgi:hypothetical protein
MQLPRHYNDYSALKEKINIKEIKDKLWNNKINTIFFFYVVRFMTYVHKIKPKMLHFVFIPEYFRFMTYVYKIKSKGLHFVFIHEYFQDT